ncbi:MAG: aldo/keto reductase [Parvibaculaceae bacterium]|nr:aldo/keto reductase [Parvibaculaceae bacterium]
MKTHMLGGLWPVSLLTMGGGGIGQVWGQTDRDEAIATLRLAVERGVNLIDLAPAYGRGEAEAVAGAAFAGGWPDHVRVTTKCMLGLMHAGDVAGRMESSLLRSLETMGRDHADLYILHSNIYPDGYVYEDAPDITRRSAIPWSLYVESVIPAFEALKAKGLIGDWGITGTGLPISIMQALREEPRPAVTQVVANLLDSAGGMRLYEEPPEPRNIIRTAHNNGVGVMGIRAVQAGALTSALDRDEAPESPEAKDYARAAPFRVLCRELGEDPAIIAHRYALAIEGVETLVVGPKNRAELIGLLDAAGKGPLEPEIMERIEALGLRRQIPRIPLDAVL